MKRLKIRSLFLPLWIFLITVSCTGAKYPISKEFREQTNKVLNFTDILPNPDSYKGTRVIWGGIILKVENKPNESQLTIQEMPLDLYGRPKDRGGSRGMFIARTDFYLDPNAYARGEKITLGGIVLGGELRRQEPPVGSPYLYPVMTVIEHYLWRESTGPYPPGRPRRWYEPYPYPPYRTPYRYPDTFMPQKEPYGP